MPPLQCTLHGQLPLRRSPDARRTTFRKAGPTFAGGLRSRAGIAPHGPFKGAKRGRVRSPIEGEETGPPSAHRDPQTRRPADPQTRRPADPQTRRPAESRSPFLMSRSRWPDNRARVSGHPEHRPNRRPVAPTPPSRPGTGPAKVARPPSPCGAHLLPASPSRRLGTAGAQPSPLPLRRPAPPQQPDRPATPIPQPSLPALGGAPPLPRPQPRPALPSNRTTRATPSPQPSLPALGGAPPLPLPQPRPALPQQPDPPVDTNSPAFTSSVRRGTAFAPSPATARPAPATRPPGRHQLPSLHFQR